MIDFIGQQGPTSKWKLAGLDTCIMLLQVVMVSVHVKRRQAKKTVAQISAGNTETSDAQEGEIADQSPQTDAVRSQDVDAEERGVLRRTDTLSDIGIDLDEEETLLPASEGAHMDALDVLISGQCVVGEFTLIDTLIDEHYKYQAFRQTRADAGASSSLSPTALRQLQTIRMRFGVGGG